VNSREMHCLSVIRYDFAAPIFVTLVRELDAWASVLLVPDETENALRCVAHHNLPSDWAALPNKLDSGSMNTRAFLSQSEVVAHGIDEDLPPATEVVSRHRMTAAAVAPVRDVGTLEVIADSKGYRQGWRITRGKGYYTMWRPVREGTRRP